MAPNTELTVVAIAGEASGLHRAHYRRYSHFRGVHLEEMHGRLELDCFKRLLVTQDGLEAFDSQSHEAAQRPQLRNRLREVRRTWWQLAFRATGGIANE